MPSSATTDITKFPTEEEFLNSIKQNPHYIIPIQLRNYIEKLGGKIQTITPEHKWNCYTDPTNHKSVIYLIFYCNNHAFFGRFYDDGETQYAILDDTPGDIPDAYYDPGPCCE